MKKLLVMFLFGIFLFGCLGPEPPVEEPIAYYGDTAFVDYILWIDGEIVDTSLEEVARDKDIYTPFRDYAPLEVKIILGEENPYIDGFVKAIVGMKENETITVDIPPGEAYGEYDEGLSYSRERYYNKSAFETLPRAYFEERNITIKNGTVFTTDIGRVFIEEFDNETVTIMYVFQPGDIFEYNGFAHNVEAILEDLTYRIRIDAEENKSYYTLSPITGYMKYVRVTEVTNDTITMDENPFLAGKTLTYNITLVDLEKASAED